MRYLFYLVHPAKFQFHKEQIKKLKKDGHTVDIVINSKDILEELLKEENWQFYNIFPEGRKIKGLHVYIAAFISIFRTIYRLLKFTKGKKYDLFIGDLLTILGRIKGVPSLYPTDDVIRQVPEQSIFLFTCKHIIAPTITDLGIFNKKKINYDGYKALAHLHPNCFSPNFDFLDLASIGNKLFLIRCTGFGATHDLGRKGIDNEVLNEIIGLLENKGDIIISSERVLPDHLEKYKFKGNKNKIHHLMAIADIFIGDSTTMCTEAALLGTPVVEYDTYWYEIEQMLELQYKYEMIHLFQPPALELMLEKISEIVNSDSSKAMAIRKKDAFIQEKIDVSEFLVWFMENYPKSYNEYKKNPFIQYKFRKR
ncbi:MAG: DUF354 domain-containing protein [Candidatus Methanofastidiosa archaeon]|nr:DUF354 domain-containing protein [Candidatus Methanofastidiosa archaeon]